MTTLRELLAAHPEWIDLPVVIYSPGDDYDPYHYLSGSGIAYEGEGESDEPILVFAPN